jgi:hypothetical protein
MAADLGGARAGGGSTAKNAYLHCLRSTLNAAICLTNFGCQEIERNNKPEVEMGALFPLHRFRFLAAPLILTRSYFAGRSREVLMNPVVVSRNESECVLIEGSINSVRISVKVKKADDLEDFLAKKFMRCVVSPAFCWARGAGIRFKVVMFQQTGTIPVADRDLQVPFAARGELCCPAKKARRGARRRVPLRPLPSPASHPICAPSLRPRHTLSGLRHFFLDHQLPHGSHVSDAVLRLLLDFRALLTL